MQTRENRSVIWPLAVFVCVLLFSFVAYNAMWAYIWRDTTPRAPLVAIADWPVPIQDLHAVLRDSGNDISSFSVCLLDGQPGQILSTVICRVSVDESGWDVIATTLDLRPISRADGMLLHSKIVPLSDSSWWPATNSQSDYFASSRLLAGGEADLYLAAHDNESNTAYVHYHFNF